MVRGLRPGPRRQPGGTGAPSDWVDGVAGLQGWFLTSGA